MVEFVNHGWHVGNGVAGAGNIDWADLNQMVQPKKKPDRPVPQPYHYPYQYKGKSYTIVVPGEIAQLGFGPRDEYILHEIRNIQARIHEEELKQVAPLVPKPMIYPSTRDKVLLPFRINYETVEEAQMRLLGTIICVNQEPMYVASLSGLAAGISLMLNDAKGNSFRVFLHQIENLRSPEPGYINWHGRVYWVARKPARIYKQGLDNKNTNLFHITRGREGFDSISDLLPGLASREIQQWDAVAPLYQKQVIGQSRLSTSVASYSAHGQIAIVYKQRTLGYVNDEKLSLSADDKRPWITKELDTVGLRWQ
jgi:hypothetical protein